LELKKWIEHNPSDLEAQLIYGYCLAFTDSKSEGLNVFRTKLPLLSQLTPDPKTLENWYFFWGSFEHFHGDRKEAKKAFQIFLKLNPDHEEALYNLASLWEEEGNLTEANLYWNRLKTIHEKKRK
jgi:tetratricopeptide (TPR) repeat protein